MKTRARKDGNTWVINGSKCWITNGGKSSWYTVMAVTDPDKGANGISAFMVHEDDPGFTVGPLEHKLGIRAARPPNCTSRTARSPTTASSATRAPASRPRWPLDHTRPTIGAQAVGVAQGARRGDCHVKDRKQFGKTISSFQGGVHDRRHGDEGGGRA